MIQANNVTLRVGKKALFEDVNIKFTEGNCYGVIGANGAGKSTMMNAIAGVWPVDAGQILIDGVDITRLPEHKRAKFLGRVFQDPMTGTAASMGIEENLALAKRRGKSRFLKAGIAPGDQQKGAGRIQGDLKDIGLGAGDTADHQGGAFIRRPAPGADPAHGHPPKAQAFAFG